MDMINLKTTVAGAIAGPLKKAAVEAGAIGFVEGMQVASTGGQKETWEKITPETVSVLIDTIATVANGISKVSGGNQIFDDSQFEINKMNAGLAFMSSMRRISSSRSFILWLPCIIEFDGSLSDKHQVRF